MIKKSWRLKEIVTHSREILQWPPKVIKIRKVQPLPFLNPLAKVRKIISREYALTKNSGRCVSYGILIIFGILP